MSVYSRCVDARGTMTIVSTPAFFQPTKPLSSSRIGSGASCGDDGAPPPRPGLAKYGATLKPYSDCTPSDGTFGAALPSASNPGSLLSLSSATTASTRLST